jgi:Zn-dependent peptidase ImmA (M78 family)/DNA-binding XRE family transcriptional regulator
MSTTKLQELRKRSGISQTDLARQIGVDASLLSRWESGEREPSFSQQMELARLLGVTVDYLVNGQLRVDFKFRSRNVTKGPEKKAIDQALTDAEQQIYFIDEVWERVGKTMKPFLLNVDVSGQQWEAAAEQIRDLLRLNQRVTYEELKQALTDRGVLVFAWHLPKDLSGLSYRGNFAVIFINKEDGEERKLFTLTHEAIHLICHLRFGKEEAQESIVSIASSRDPQEKEANRLAAELLMPSVAMREIVSEFGERLKRTVFLDGIARSFNVSREAMFYRLVDFGVFSWNEKSRYFSKAKEEEMRYPARVTEIAEQVAPDFQKLALSLYSAEEISAGKLAEWFACSRLEVDKYLSVSDRPQVESGLLQ